MSWSTKKSMYLKVILRFGVTLRHYSPVEISYQPASKSISPCFAASLAAGLPRRQDTGRRAGDRQRPGARDAARAQRSGPRPRSPLAGPRTPPAPRPALTAAGPSLPARAGAEAAFSLCRVRHRPPPDGSRRSSPGGRRRRELSARRRDGSAMGSGVATGTAASRRGADPASAGSQAGPLPSHPRPAQ